MFRLMTRRRQKYPAVAFEFNASPNPNRPIALAPSVPGPARIRRGSMGDDAVIIEGVDSEEARASLYSTVHGAGRLFGRREAKRRFARAEMDAWLASRGVTLVGADLDESPMAYRRLPEVIAEHAGTVRVLHTLGRSPSPWPAAASSIRGRIEQARVPALSRDRSGMESGTVPGQARDTVRAFHTFFETPPGRACRFSDRIVLRP